MKPTHRSPDAPIAPRIDTLAYSNREILLRKSMICGGILVETQRLLAIGHTGPALQQLVLRACELLEEVDELLLGIDPVRDQDLVARIGMLHRRLEQAQTAALTTER